MPQYKNGFPKPNGATDWMDSAHLAGIMNWLGHAKAPAPYLYFDYTNPVRCPDNDDSGLCPNNPKNFTRDQMICLVAGLAKVHSGLVRTILLNVLSNGNRAPNTEKDKPGSTKKWPDGPDYLDPSHIGYLKICAGQEPSRLARIIMIARIYINGWFTSLKEPNNIIVMSWYYGYIDLLKKRNPKLKQAIYDYWAGWRDEKEIADLICEKIGL